MRTRALVLALILVAPILVASCGGGEATGDIPDVRGTPKAEGGEAGEPAERASWAPVSEARPMRHDDLVIRVPRAPHTGSRPIRIELRNRSSDPIRVAPAWLHASVFYEGARLRACASPAPRPLEGVDAIGAGESVFTTVRLPCALERPGVYRVVVVLLAPERVPDAPQEPTDALASGFGEVVVR